MDHFVMVRLAINFGGIVMASGDAFTASRAIAIDVQDRTMKVIIIVQATNAIRQNVWSVLLIQILSGVIRVPAVRFAAADHVNHVKMALVWFAVMIQVKNAVVVFV